jgi:sugar phosphate permease
MSAGAVGTMFFVVTILGAISIITAASLARRIGNIQTMAYAHLPSSITLALIGIPSQMWLAIVFVMISFATASTDIAPRSAFLSAVVLPHERTVTIGIVNIARTTSQAFGPVVAGTLYGEKLYWVAFLAAGSLKVMYDLGLLLLFRGRQTREDPNQQQPAGDTEEIVDTGM